MSTSWWRSAEGPGLGESPVGSHRLSGPLSSQPCGVQRWEVAVGRGEAALARGSCASIRWVLLVGQGRMGSSAPSPAVPSARGAGGWVLGECRDLQQAGAGARPPVDTVMVTWSIAELWVASRDLLAWALPKRLCPSLSIKNDVKLV